MHFVESPCNLGLYPNKLAQKTKKMIFVNSKKNAVIYEKNPLPKLLCSCDFFFPPCQYIKKGKKEKCAAGFP